MLYKVPVRSGSFQQADGPELTVLAGHERILYPKMPTSRWMMRTLRNMATGFPGEREREESRFGNEAIYNMLAESFVVRMIDERMIQIGVDILYPEFCMNMYPLCSRIVFLYVSAACPSTVCGRGLG